jgi:hypothetical protein
MIVFRQLFLAPFFIAFSCFSSPVMCSDLLDQIYGEAVSEFYANFNITSNSQDFSNEQGSIYYSSKEGSLYIQIAFPVTHEILVNKDCLFLNDLAISQISIHQNESILPSALNYLFFGYNDSIVVPLITKDADDDLLRISFEGIGGELDEVSIQYDDHLMNVSFVSSDGGSGQLNLTPKYNQEANPYRMDFLDHVGNENVIDTTDGTCSG